MIYAGNATGETKNVPTSKADRTAFVLSYAEILDLACMGTTIKVHYGKPMDMGSARDDNTGQLLIVHSRPETCSPGSIPGRSNPLGEKGG